MTSLIRRAFFLAVGGVLLLSMPAKALTITVNSLHGTAVFDIQSTFINITLSDNFNPTTAIAQELDGFAFTLTGGSGTLALTAAGTFATGEIDCTGGTAVCAPVNPIDPAPWGWTLGGTTNNLTLFAGGGSLHPYAIVNANTNGSLDGVANGQHNPLLVGPVTFHLALNGTAPTGVLAATFYFGTGGDTEPCTNCTGTIDTRSGGINPVPEPASLLLIGSGLVIGARRVRRSWKRK